MATDQTGHGMDHIDRVRLLITHLLKSEPTADEFITLAAGILHDTYDDKLTADVAIAKQNVVTFLNKIGVTTAQASEIFQIIDNMSWSKQRFGQPEPLTLAGQIVQDADRLEAIGAIAVARVIQYGVQAGHALYDPTMPPRELKTKAEYRDPTGETMINHFYEKLFLLKDYLNTTEAKRIGEKRDRVMRAFVAAFEDEWASRDYLSE
nr:HD domain-containing protein [Weissella soli]